MKPHRTREWKRKRSATSISQSTNRHDGVWAKGEEIAARMDRKVWRYSLCKTTRALPQRPLRPSYSEYIARGTRRLPDYDSPLVTSFPDIHITDSSPICGQIHDKCNAAKSSACIRASRVAYSHFDSSRATLRMLHDWMTISGTLKIINVSVCQER